MGKSVGQVSTSQKPPKREPTPQEQRGIDKALAYCRGRTAPIAFEISKAEGSDISVGIPHNNAGGFIAQQRATFGTVSQAFADRAGGEVGNALRNRGEALPSPNALNAGVAAIAGIEPQNEQEAMLAVQMVGTHAMAMEMMNLAKQTESPDRLERYGNLATKFLRTYTTQMETLAKLRRGGEQTVRVEHVHVYQGGQAVVHQVTQVGGQHGGSLENENQAHALIGSPAHALPAGTPMLRQDTGGAGMPVARGGREEAVPDARGSRRKRGAER
ncbi:hypothetical protein [Methylorubrum suomiense]|uniref:Uncharacterized protein n=2 Tax=Methylorubrum suomiense TaxID=144191 RepID=A0ABQ4V3I1_9HYPH|nr:hypothetical protein BGCPKDLD_5186 [Methylorubrum suomiense]